MPPGEDEVTEEQLLAAVAKASPEAAQHLRDYWAARKYFGTSASYMAREMDWWDQLYVGGEELVSRTWLAEHAMVSLWKALGRPDPGEFERMQVAERDKAIAAIALSDLPEEMQVRAIEAIKAEKR